MRRARLSQFIANMVSLLLGRNVNCMKKPLYQYMGYLEVRCLNTLHFTFNPKSKAKSSNFKASSCEVGVRFTTLSLPDSLVTTPSKTDSNSFSEHFSAFHLPCKKDATHDQSMTHIKDRTLFYKERGGDGRGGEGTEGEGRGGGTTQKFQATIVFV